MCAKGTHHRKVAESGQNNTLSVIILSLYTIGVSGETVFTLNICLTTGFMAFVVHVNVSLHVISKMSVISIKWQKLSSSLRSPLTVS